MLEWNARDSFEFEKASHVSRCSFPDPCAFYSISYYVPFWCDLCSSSNHETNLCRYYACYDQPYLATPLDNTDVVLALHDSSFPFAQCTGLEASEPFGFDARFGVTDACVESEDTLEEVYNLIETPLEESRDVFVPKDSPNLGFDNNVLPNLLDHAHASPLCSLPSSSAEYYIVAQLVIL